MFVSNFLAPVQVQSSVIPLATGDELIKFWKHDLRSVRCALYWTPF